MGFQNTLKRFSYFNAMYHHLLEHTFLNLNDQQKMLIYLISEFQLFGIIILNLYKTQIINSLMNILYGLNIISYISRPYFFLQQNNEFFTYSYILPITLILLYLIHQSIIYYRFINQNQRNIHEFVIKSNNFNYIQNALAIYFILFYDQILDVIMNQLTCISLAKNIQKPINEIIQLLNSIFSIFILFILVIFKLFILIIIKESLQLTPQNFKVLILTYSDYIENIFSTIFVLIDCFTFENDRKNYIICSFYIIIQIIKLNTLQRKLQYSNNIQNYLIKLNSFTLGLTIILLGGQIFKQDQNIISMLIVSTLLFVYLIKQIKQDLDLIKMITIQTNPKTQSLQYLISIYSSNKQLYTIQLILLQLFLSHHKQQCSDNTCICQKNYEQHNEQKLKMLFLKSIVVEFGKSINKIQDQSIKGFYSIYYIQGLIQINQSVKAYQQTNILLLKQKIYQLNEQQQNYFSEQTTYSVTVDENQNMVKKKSNNELIHKLERISLNNLTYVNQIKLKIILEISKQNLIASFSYGDILSKSSLSKSVQLFMKVEEQHQKLKINIINILNKKKDIFLIMTSTNKQNNENFLHLCLDLIENINIMENSLQRLFQEFPSKKMQSIYSFYCAEILSNFLQAFRVINYNAISDNSLIKIQKNYTIDLLSNQLHYMILVMDHQGTGLSIVQQSEQLYQVLGYDQQEVKEIKTILPLLPKGFTNIHKILIENFLIYGKSKFFREQNINYILTKSGYLKTVEFFFDFDLTKLSELTFQVFLQDYSVSSAFIILNNKNTILGATKEFCKLFKISFALQSNFYEYLSRQDIQTLIPDYHQLIDSTQFNQSQIFNNVTIQYLEYNFNSQRTNSTPNNFSKMNQENIRYFLSNIVIILKQNHTIIEIKNAIETKKSIQLEQSSELEISNLDDILQELHIPEPQIENEELFLKQISKKNKNIQQQEVPTFNELINNLNQTENQKTYLVSQHRQLLSESIQQYDLYSPGVTSRQLIDKTNSFQTNQQFTSTFQQKFYQKKDNIQNQEEDEQDKQSKNSSQESDQLQKYFNKISDQQQQKIEIKENLKLQLQDENQTSLFNKKITIDNAAASSTLGTFSQNFQLYKKYELLQEFVQSTKFSVYFELMVFSLFLVSLVSLIFSSLLINNSNKDIFVSLSQMDMLYFYSSFIVPSYSFISAFTATVNYKTGNYTENQQIELVTLLNYTQYAMQQSYYNIKQSLENQSQGSLLQDFLQTKNVTYIEINNNNQEYNSISLREQIFDQIQYHYQLQYLFQDEEELYQQNYSLLTYIINTEQIDECIAEMNDEIVNYLENSNIIIQSKWIIMCVRCVYLILLFQLASWLLYIKHFRKYSKILKLFQKSDQVWIMRDLERCKEILNYLNKDSTIIFRYKFNIFLKERFFKSEITKKHTIQDRLHKAGMVKQHRKQKFTLKRLPSFLLFFVLFSIFFFFSFILTYQGINFLDFYQLTTQQFNDIGDVVLSGCKLYSLREILYFKNENLFNFSLITENQSENYILRIQQNFITINDYLQNYIIPNSNFANDNLLQLNNQSLCEYKSLEIQLSKQQLILCEQIYDSTLSRGLPITFTVIRDTLLNEMNSSQYFTIRNDKPFNEIEIGIYLGEILKNVLKQIKEEITLTAENLNNILTAISIIYIIYSILQFFIIIINIRTYYISEFQKIKKSVILLPQAALFIDDLFERQLRQLIAKEALV